MKAIFLAALLMSAPILSAPARAQEGTRATTLSLSAQGETRLAPDMASISLSVQTQAPTAAAALRRNADKMAAVIAALHRNGLADRQIQTSGLNLSPQYAYDANQPPRLTGYQAVDQLTVTVEDLRALGPALDDIVASGANEISAISFGLKDPQTAEDAARRAAVKILAARADLYAAAAGYHVVRLVNLSEGGGYSPAPPRPLPMMALAKSATPIEPGEMGVRIEVSAIYELAR